MRLQKVVPALTHTLTDNITPAVTNNLKEFLSQTVTTRVTGVLTQKLDDSLSITIPEQVETDAPHKTAIQSIRFLGQLVSRALTHTLVSSLTHTLTHSPLTDYYCYYCKTKKQYCQYCQYQPQQFYYAMNCMLPVLLLPVLLSKLNYFLLLSDAGYYSTYFGRYYAEMYSSQAEHECTLFVFAFLH